LLRSCRDWTNINGENDHNGATETSFSVVIDLMIWFFSKSG